MSTRPFSHPAVQFPETWVHLARWCVANGLPEPRRLSMSASGGFAIACKHGVLVLQPGSREAQWGGVEVRLGFPPRLINDELSVHQIDLIKTAWPLLSGRQLEFATRPVVLVIDPGHGGPDAGTRSASGLLSEKDFTLDWARRLSSLLPTNHWQVWLTRTNDSEVTLSNRVSFAEDHHAALFVSLHFNSAAPDAAQTGLETYCLTPMGAPSTLTREFSDQRGLSFPNNEYDLENLVLALQLHRSLLPVSGNRDRGVRRARFPAVLRGQRRPAALVEGGYLSNPVEAELISRPAHRERLAEALANGLNEAAGFRPTITEVMATPSSSVDTILK